MDLYRTVDRPIAVVFGYLAAPGYLGEWLPEAMLVVVDGVWQPGVGATFALRSRNGGDGAVGTGDVVAYEPPWQVAYRLCVGPLVRILRVACTACDGGTRVHVHQGGGPPLAVDLTALTRAVAAVGDLDDIAAGWD